MDVGAAWDVDCAAVACVICVVLVIGAVVAGAVDATDDGGWLEAAADVAGLDVAESMTDDSTDCGDEDPAADVGAGDDESETPPDVEPPRVPVPDREFWRFNRWARARSRGGEARHIARRAKVRRSIEDFERNCMS